MDPQWMDSDFLKQLTGRAAAAGRRRMNHNFHPTETDPCQRLCNAMEPDSYIVPHRHLAGGKEETLVVLQGRLGFLCFADDGAVTVARELVPGGACAGVHLPLGCWHTVIALQPGSVMFECKHGPYRPLTPEEIAPWAPQGEGIPVALAAWRKLVEATRA